MAQPLDTVHRVYRFALRGRWLVGTLLVLAVAGLCVRLGFWQLDRLDQRRAANAERAARPDEAVPLPDDPAEGLYWRVTAEGEYETDRERILGGRAHEGRPGEHVLTPLAVEGGGEILVNRGWVPNNGATRERAPSGAEPPAGRVTVTGVLVPAPDGVDGGEGGDGGDGVVLRLERQQPPQPEIPVPPGAGAENAERDEGPHLSYAVQWFLFATVALVGWPLLLRRTARSAPTAPNP